MDYVLVGDDCHECNYVRNAFTFLSLPLKLLTLENLLADQISSRPTAFVCKNIESCSKEHLISLSNSKAIHLVSWNEPHFYESIVKKYIKFLKMPFSKFEFKNLLAHLIHPIHPDHDLHHSVFDKLIGQSEKIRKIKLLIQQVAASDSTVLILGQSGTGKEVIASCTHHASPRHNHSLVPINCGAIPSELMESELFGHEKGAFTGALARRPGRFEIANGGTLFLDEIGDMPLPMQVKLLRVIQDRKIERVGGNISINVDVRLIAATHKNLEELIKQNLFREDLFYRLNVFPIELPSLRERSEDIPLLIEYHLDKIFARIKHRVTFTQRAEEILSEYSWPGNIRELQNFLERMVILHPDQVIDETNLDPLYTKHSSKSPKQKSA